MKRVSDKYKLICFILKKYSFNFQECNDYKKQLQSIRNEGSSRVRRGLLDGLFGDLKDLNVEDIFANIFKKKTTHRPLIQLNFASHGTPVLSFNKYPHMTRIGFKTESDIMFYCGGSLISETFIISAAHCKRNNDGGVSNVVRLDYGSDFDIEKFLNHPNYSGIRKANDIALIELKNKIRLDFRESCKHSLKYIHF